MKMGNLFSEHSGFRLKRLEIYNWGTFDKEIWVMNPECQTAVLTGANGSGKSTVVDALLTLLVDSRQRNYNLASGAGSGRERSERTYVRGQYSRSRGDTAIEAKANTLRDSQSHSVLLAVFYDTSQDRTVTLVQVLWISNVDRVEKRFYIASHDLCIEKHFPQRHLTIRDFPQPLQKDIAIFSSFTEYSNSARKALGLSGKAKAISLFNETVSVKDIASLNTFVRDHMLDKGNPEEKVEALRTQYRELNEAYGSIQRASDQLHILSPLVKAGHDYMHYQDQIARYETAKTLVPFYVASRARDLLVNAINQTQQKYDVEQSHLGRIDTELTNLRQQLERVNISIAQDSVGQEKREIQGKIHPLKGQIQALKRAADRYDENAQSLVLPTYQTEDDFYENRTNAKQLQQTLIDTIQNFELQRSTFEINQRDLIAQAKSLDTEIQYLRVNPSNIPQNIAKIRQMICDNLFIAVDELLFVGELLKVRDEDSQWEGALERLFNNFAQDLIVPESLYQQVSRYINENNLKGRLIYHRVDPLKRPERVLERRNEQAQHEIAYEKLEILANTPYHEWLVHNLMQRFDYVCCYYLPDFQQVQRGITLQGQIKHNASRHEKDDRHTLSDRSRYVLGWDNRQKLRQLEQELDDLGRHLAKLEDEIQKIRADLDRNRRDISTIENLLNYQLFSEIDWRTPQSEHDMLERRLTELNQQSQQLQQLENQQDKLQGEITEKTHQRDKITGDIGVLKNQITTYGTQLTREKQILDSSTDEHLRLWEHVRPIIEEIDKDPLTIDAVNNRTSQLEVSIQRGINSFRGLQGQLETAIVNAMNTFRRDYPDIGVALLADLSSLDAFLQIYNRLETDDLPRYQDRFKDMLDRTVTRGIQMFYGHLTEQERQIDKSIAELNDSLAQVDYGGGSIIRLIADRTNDTEIHDFLRDLRACFADVGDNSDEERNRAYNRIKLLIEHFDNDPNWMRRVTDVRRWRVFAAEQIDSNGLQVDYYNDSSGKSGGQKAKLAYTILASAIAHQYGLQDAVPNNRTFRFVVIDEAFSKLDDDNARFAMKLFAQLGLQLLVVTPMQQLHVIEGFVQAYHVVVNNNEGSYSRLFNLTHSEYRQRQREFQN